MLIPSLPFFQLETTNSAPDFTKFWNMAVVRFLNIFTRKESLLLSQGHSTVCTLFPFFPFLVPSLIPSSQFGLCSLLLPFGMECALCTTSLLELEACGSQLLSLSLPLAESSPPSTLSNSSSLSSLFPTPSPFSFFPHFPLPAYPRFIPSPEKRSRPFSILLFCVTYFLTHAELNFAGGLFSILDLEIAFRVMKSLYFFGVIGPLICIILGFLASLIPTSKEREAKDRK